MLADDALNFVEGANQSGAHLGTFLVVQARQQAMGSRGPAANAGGEVNVSRVVEKALSGDFHP